MNEYLELGRVNRLRIAREMDHGYYLTSAGEHEVLLPRRYVRDDMKIGDEIEVFVYSDSEDRLVATTERPKAMLGEFGFFEVVDVTDFGAFVDWGLSKDLFVPRNRMKRAMKVGDKRILHVAYDAQSDRLMGEERLQKFLKTDLKGLKKFQEVDILIFAKTPMGFKVIVNNTYEGMIFHNEIFETVHSGQHKKAYIKNIRSDGKVDLSLQPIGAKNSDHATEKIVDLLNQYDGFIPYNYKSDADRIKTVFGLSKKAYKKALTALINAKKIEVTEEGTKRV